jgi:hypothetical protein
MRVLPVGRPVGCLPYRVRGIDQVRGAVVQIVDEERTAHVLLGGCCFCANRRRLSLESGSHQKERDQGDTAESQLDRENLHIYRHSSLDRNRKAVPLLTAIIISTIQHYATVKRIGARALFRSTAPYPPSSGERRWRAQQCPMSRASANRSRCPHNKVRRSGGLLVG